MSFVQNVPCFSILFPMFAAIITSAVNGKTARKISIILSALVGAMSFWLLMFLIGYGDSYVYIMGHYPAPWGNELKAGQLEAAMALLFCGVMFVSVMGGKEDCEREVQPEKASFFYIMADLLLAANLALVYTNDLFTAYVFVEISTIAACGLILGRYHEFTIAAAIRYMVMSLMGSGMLLLGICFLYDMTGELLMESARTVIDASVMTNPDFKVPFIITIGLIGVGLAIKSALWPFHSWLPDAYGHSTTTASGMLSSLASKGYIFLLIKILIRVVGYENIMTTKITTIFFIFGVAGMMFGSIEAIFQKSVRKLVAYSSIAQIGYIYMGIGMASYGGMQASIYHIFAHAIAKTLVFVSIAGLIKASDYKKIFSALTGSGIKNKFAGVGYVCGALSMIGIPAFGGFVSKMMFATSSWGDADWKTPVVLAALAVSTLLNAIYFMKVAICIYTPLSREQKAAGIRYEKVKNSLSFDIAVVVFAAAILFIGLHSSALGGIIINGLNSF